VPTGGAPAGQTIARSDQLVAWRYAFVSRAPKRATGLTNPTSFGLRRFVDRYLVSCVRGSSSGS
jgi:hypothetical protein